jgi:hypothetical protein
MLNSLLYLPGVLRALVRRSTSNTGGCHMVSTRSRVKRSTVAPMALIWSGVASALVAQSGVRMAVGKT